MEQAASKRLLDMELDGGWRVIEAVEKTGTQTGGFFSQGYIVRSTEGKVAFLKAMDFSTASQAPDFARAIESIARQFNFERDLLEFCKDQRMRNVVRSIGDGLIDVVGDGNPLNRVQYFLFEPAEGDIRRLMDGFEQLTAAWCLKVLHETAVGLRQLHTALIAHQDLKPSNVLIFLEGDRVKIGDLGCASIRGRECPRDALNIPGQISYAPPEQLYSFVHGDWVARRIGSDMYQLGGMCVFLLIGPSINSLLTEKLDPAYHWSRWTGGYAEALPQLKLAFARLMDDLSVSLSGYAAKILPIVRELCEPDLVMRGPPNRLRGKGVQYSLEPYVSRLGNLRREAQYSAKQVVR